MSNYYAVDEYDIEQLIAAFELRGQALLATNANSSAYALIDCAFMPLQTLEVTRKGINLFDGTAIRGMDDVAPYLLVLSKKGEKRKEELSKWLTLCQGKPMISLFWTALPEEMLVNYLKALTAIQTEDQLCHPLRFADTRILPSLLQTLTPSQRTDYLPPSTVWCWPDRTGRLVSHAIPAVAAPKASEVKLSDKQFANMITLSEPDHVLQRLYDARPEFTWIHKHSENFRLVKQAVDALLAKNLENMSILMQYSSWALYFPDCMDNEPEFKALWDHAESEQSFLTALNELPLELIHKSPIASKKP